MLSTYILWLLYAMCIALYFAIATNLYKFLFDKAQKIDETYLKSKLVGNKLAIEGARVSLRVGYGIYDGKEILQLIDPNGKVVFQKVDNGSSSFWENTYNDGHAFIKDARDRLWPKE